MDTETRNALVALGLVGAGAVAIMGIGGKDDQLSIEASLKQQIVDFEDGQMAKEGKYTHIPETQFSSEFPSTYRVDEMLYPDGTRGYQIIFNHKETEQVLDATTSKLVTKEVKTLRSVGFGKEAQKMTYEEQK